jgi:hypothetical protein
MSPDGTSVRNGARNGFRGAAPSVDIRSDLRLIAEMVVPG